MSGNNIISDDKKINKSNIYKNKKQFNIYEINVEKILISKKRTFGILGYNDDDVIRPLCIKLPLL